MRKKTYDFITSHVECRVCRVTQNDYNSFSSMTLTLSYDECTM